MEESTGSKQKQQDGGQPRKHDEELPKRRAVVTVKVYEEPPPGAVDRRLRPAADRPKPRPAPSLGYDRKQLLLAYSQQLRQASGAEVATAKWGKWRAAFACGGHSMRKMPLQSKLQLWIRRLLGRSRGRRCRYYRITTGDDDSRSCCDHISSTLAWIKRRWRRAITRVSRAWRCCSRGTDGCSCQELCS